VIRYLRIGGLCFSLAVIVSLLGFVTAFAEEPTDQTTVDTVQSSEKQEQPKMNQETDTQRNHNSTRSNTAKPNSAKAQKSKQKRPTTDTLKPAQQDPVEATTVKSSKSNSSE